MPQLGETVTEGTITRWFKQVGESIAVDEPLFEVSTDKVDSEVPAPSAGVVSEILVPEGETVPVGARLAVISSDGDGAAAPPAAAEAPAPAPEAPAAEAAAAEAPAAEAPAAETPPVPEPEPAPPPPPPPPPPSTPAAGTSTRAAAAASAAGVVASPIVRRLIAEHGLDPAQINGTGEGGRITRNDVLAAARTAPPASRAPAAAPAPAPAPAAAPPAPIARGTGDEVVAFDNIRRRTAEHMVRSKATSAHVYTSVRVDFERVERTRPRAPGRVEGERGLLAHVSAVHRARVLRRRPRVPARQRERRRRHARRAPRHQPRDRSRPGIQGPDRAGHPQRRRQALAADRARGARPRCRARRPSSSVPTR